MCQACLEKNYGGLFSRSAKAGRGHSKVVTFGGVTEIEQPVETVTSSEGEETELLRRLLSKATVAMPTIGLGSWLSERECRYEDEAKYNLGLNPESAAIVWSALRSNNLCKVIGSLLLYKLLEDNCLSVPLRKY